MLKMLLTTGADAAIRTLLRARARHSCQRQDTVETLMDVPVGSTQAPDEACVTGFMAGAPVAVVAITLSEDCL